MSTVTLDPPGRLIATATEPGRAVGWNEHLAVHGPLTIPVRDDPAWASAIGRAVAQSGLLGRGGAAFPAAVKWDAFKRSSRRPMVVVNAMEGEPASAKDRMLLGHAPHLVLDGADVAAAVIGASEIAVCVPAGNDSTADSVLRAISERTGRGRRRCRMSVLRPPRRYVTGEESALAAWLDGGRALPALRIDKSVPLTAARRPILVHNAETLGQVALIARHGPAWFRAVGTPEAPGSTLVTITGSVLVPGVVEVELGTPVADVVARAGAQHPLAAVLIGGYGGSWLDGSALTTPFAAGPLPAVGATQGVGVVIVLPVTSCGITETARVARYMAGESAGQCGPCVFGLPALADDLELLAGGRAEAGVLGRIERRAAQIDGRGACRHPDGVVRLVRSALAVFSDDAQRHARGHPCPGHREPTVMTFPREQLPDPGWSR